MVDANVDVSVSVVIPVYNEQDSLRPLYAELEKTLTRIPGGYEIIFVDDGSRDGSWEEISELHREQSAVSAIRFRRNFGKAAALQAGFSLARGRYVVTLDADLQDDPAEIPGMMAMVDEGYDLVSGWKYDRKDPWHKVYPSRVFNWMVSKLTGVHLHDHNCGLKCYRSEVLAEIQLYGEFHRFTPVLAAARGFRIGEARVHHRARRHGESKYGWTRFISGLLDVVTVKFLTSYQHRPQHLMGTLGLFATAVGALGMSYLTVIWLLTRLGMDFEPIGGRPLLTFSATAFLFGVQICTIGLIGELITFRAQRDEQAFSISEELLASERRNIRTSSERNSA